MNTEEIIGLLTRYGVPIGEWRRGKTTKSFDDLVREISEGEAKLAFQDNRVVWVSRVVNVTVTSMVADEARVLRENYQRLAIPDFHGSVWRRAGLESSFSGLVGYKDVNLHEAARRIILERLGLPRATPTDLLCEGQAARDVGTGESEAYPGLAARYKAYFFEWLMPPELFRPSGYVEIRDDRTIHYEWRSKPVETAE